MQKASFTAAMKQYFGFRKGDTVSQFAVELKALSYQEKMEFWHMLTTQAGIDCDPPPEPAK
jgi:hypothetical protein